MHTTTCRYERNGRQSTFFRRSLAYVSCKVCLPQLSENFIFIYLGLSLFTGEGLVYRPLLIVFSLVAVVASRYCSVFPIAWILNKAFEMHAQRRRMSSGLPQEAHVLPLQYQLMLFWAGLRGAVGFALSKGMSGVNAPALQTTVLVVVVLTVIVFGGTTAQMLEVLHIDTGIDDDEDDASIDMDDPDAQTWLRPASARMAPPPTRYRDVSGPFTDEVLPQWDASVDRSTQAVVAERGGLRTLTGEELDQALQAEIDSRNVLGEGEGSAGMLNGALLRDGQWFQRIDERYLLPMFSNTVANRKYEQRREQVQARRAASREWTADDSNASHITTTEVSCDTDFEADTGRISPGKNKIH